MANENSETGYNTPPLSDAENDDMTLDILCGQTVLVLNDMGVAQPKTFPADLKDALADEEPWELFEDKPYTRLIDKIYKAYTDVYGFYVAYVDELLEDDNGLPVDGFDDVEPCLLVQLQSQAGDRAGPEAGQVRLLLPVQPLRDRIALEALLNEVDERHLLVAPLAIDEVLLRIEPLSHLVEILHRFGAFRTHVAAVARYFAAKPRQMAMNIFNKDCLQKRTSVMSVLSALSVISFGVAIVSLCYAYYSNRQWKQQTQNLITRLTFQPTAETITWAQLDEGLDRICYMLAEGPELFDPDLLLGVGGGGTAIADMLSVRLWLNKKIRLPVYATNIQKDYRSPKTQPSETPDAHLEAWVKDKRVLLIEDFFLGGESLVRLVKRIGDSHPKELRLLVFAVPARAGIFAGMLGISWSQSLGYSMP